MSEILRILMFQRENRVAAIPIQRNPSQVWYSTVNGITTPNYKASKVPTGKPPTGKKKLEEKVSSAAILTSSNSNTAQQLDEMTLCLTSRYFKRYTKNLHITV